MAKKSGSGGTDGDFMEAALKAAGAQIRTAAEAWSTDEVAVGMVHTRESTANAYNAGQDLELAAQAEAHGYFGMAQESRAKALESIKRQPPPPPIQVGFGREVKVLPQSLSRAPRILHDYDAQRASQLFDIFCKGKKQLISRLAAKGGLASRPFCYLTQHLYRIMEFQGFYPTVTFNADGKMQQASFNPATDGNQDSHTRESLREWTGPELEKLIVTRCAKAGIGIQDGLRQMYKELGRQLESDVDRARKFQTIYEWAGDEADDND